MMNPAKSIRSKSARFTAKHLAAITTADLPLTKPQGAEWEDILRQLAAELKMTPGQLFGEVVKSVQ